MKKTIKDLKIGDVVFVLSQNSTFSYEKKIEVLSKTKVLLDSGDEFIMQEGDNMRWNFKASRHSTVEVYLEKIDMLKVQRERLNKKLEEIHANQQDFLKLQQSAIEEILKNVEQTGKEIQNK